MLVIKCKIGVRVGGGKKGGVTLAASRRLAEWRDDKLQTWEIRFGGSSRKRNARRREAKRVARARGANKAFVPRIQP